jgi:2-iminobutanoate/2-iminopropanoate deaminase
MRQLSRVVRVGLAVTGLVVPAVAGAQRQAVVPAGMNASATLTPGIRAGDVIYTSGQLGLARDATDSTIQTQTKKALENVKAVVEAGGGTMASVVKCTVFLVDVKDFAGMNSVYSSFFPKEPPARSTVIVAALVSAAAKLEVECIATVTK